MILECLKVLQKAQSRDDGWKSLYSKSVQDFAIPGDSSFPINAYFHKPRSSQEAQKMKDYLKVRKSKTQIMFWFYCSASSTWNCHSHAWCCIGRQWKTKQMVDVFHKKKVSWIIPFWSWILEKLQKSILQKSYPTHVLTILSRFN